MYVATRILPFTRFLRLERRQKAPDISVNVVNTVDYDDVGSAHSGWTKTSFVVALAET